VKTGANMTMGIQPITTSAVLKGQEKGGNALNLSPEPQQCKLTKDKNEC